MRVGITDGDTETRSVQELLVEKRAGVLQMTTLAAAVDDATTTFTANDARFAKDDILRIDKEH